MLGVGAPAPEHVEDLHLEEQVDFYFHEVVIVVEVEEGMKGIRRFAFVWYGLTVIVRDLEVVMVI